MHTNADPVRRELFDQWRPLAFAIARKFMRTPEHAAAALRCGLVREDLSQLAQMALWRAALIFNPAISDSFGTLGGRCAKRAVCHAVFDRKPLPIEPMPPRLADRKARPVAEQVHIKLLGERVAVAVDALPQLDRECLLRYAEGETFAEIAADHGVTKQRMQARAARARRVLAGGLGRVAV